MDYENEVACYIPFFDVYITAKFETLVRITEALNTELDRIGLLDLWHILSIIDSHLDNEHKLSYKEGPMDHIIGFFASDDEASVFELWICDENYAKEIGASFEIYIEYGYAEVLA